MKNIAKYMNNFWKTIVFFSFRNPKDSPIPIKNTKIMKANGLGVRMLLIFFFLFSCSKKEETSETKAVVIAQDIVALNDSQTKSAGIETATLNSQNISEKIKLNGSIDVPPQGMASVSAPSGGFVRVSRFMPGNFVAKGQTLAILDNPDLVQLQQDYLLAKSNFSFAEKDYNRQKDLNKQKASSDKVTQKSQNEAQNQNIMVHGMAEKLRALGINPNSLTTSNIRRSVAVVSPISGYISSVNVNIGQYVSPNEKLFDIVNTDDIHLALKVFEKDLNKISVGQTVYGYTNENPDKKYTAKIILIGRDFAPDRSVLIHCHFQNYEPHLIPGTYMNADVETSSQNGFTIPDDAVVTWEEKQYIFEEIKPKTYKMFPVTIGNSENGHTQLLNFNSTNSSKKFVIKGAYNLLMALKNVEE